MALDNKLLLVCVLVSMMHTLFAAENEVFDRQFADDMMRLAGFDKFPKTSARVKWEVPKRFAFDGEEYILTQKDKGLYVYVNLVNGKSVSFKIRVEFGESIYSMLYDRCISHSMSSMPGTASDKAKRPQLVVDDQTVVIYSKRGISAELFHNNMRIHLWNTNCDAKTLALALLYAGLKEVEANGQSENTDTEARDED